MDVTREVVGGATHEIELAADATYGDGLAAGGVSTPRAHRARKGAKPAPKRRIGARRSPFGRRRARRPA